MEKIKTQGLKMKPRIFFALKGILIISAAVLVALLCLFLFSFIIFACKASGACYVSGFGRNGFMVFLNLFPWALVLALLSLFLILETLIKKFSLAYKRPVIYSLAVIAFFIALGGTLVNKTPLHPHLWERAEQNRLPFAGRMYFGLAEKRPDQMHFLEITATTTDGFMAKTPQNQEIHVVITEVTKTVQGLQIKDKIIVFGWTRENVLQAQGIKKIGSDFRIPQQKERINPGFPKMQ